MINSLVFNKKNLKHVIIINKENPFYKINYVIIPSIKQGDKQIRDKVRGVSLSYKNCIAERHFEGNSIFGDLSSLVSLNHIDGIIQIDLLICDDSRYKYIELNCEIDREDNFEMVLFYETLDLSIPLKEPFEEFKNHLDRDENVKILFSAPFGQGKTTFLNYFFEEHKTQYEIFKLYPVNYSVSHNEDIFKYIKCELLFQLLGRDVEFDKDKFSYLLTAPEFFSKNIHHFLAPFLFLLPKVGKSASDIYEKYYKLAKEYFEYHSKQETDDNNEAISFIKELYEEEGSIYEDNFYTQLIRQLIEQIKGTTKKQTVLLIEDLDRMDPEHIFRTLNVFAAHFDSQEYNGGFANKFGFDKIIIVCDFSNLRELFAHRFGHKTDFGGYINKYFSIEPFHFSYKDTKILINKIKDRNSQRDQMELFALIMHDILSTGNLRTREITKLGRLDMVLINKGLPSINLGQVTVTRGETTSKNKNIFFILFPILHYLSKLGDIDSIIEKLRKTSTTINNDHRKKDIFNFTQLTAIGFIPLVFDEYLSDEPYSYTFKGTEYIFRIKQNSISTLGFNPYIIDGLQAKNKTDPVLFTKKDFYEVLILNAQKYKELGMGK